MSGIELILVSDIFLSMKINVIDLGLVNYKEAYSFQKENVLRVLDGQSQKLIFCQHPLVLTMGRMTKENSLLADMALLQKKDIQIEKIDRGGDITLHNEGQLIAYPIFDLNNYRKDLKWYLHQLEDAVIGTLDHFGLKSGRNDLNTGVWIDQRKICSMGIGVKKWVTYHGIGLNINNDLNDFSLIKPCGLDVGMTSVKDQGFNVSVQEVQEIMTERFKKVFN